MSGIANIAAQLAAKLVDDIEGLDDSGALKLEFRAIAEGLPDSNSLVFPVTVTREALWWGGEWNWTKTTVHEEMAIATTRKATP